jgi:hypothetical protein
MGIGEMRSDRDTATSTARFEVLSVARAAMVFLARVTWEEGRRRAAAPSAWLVPRRGEHPAAADLDGIQRFFLRGKHPAGFPKLRFHVPDCLRRSRDRRPGIRLFLPARRHCCVVVLVPTTVVWNVLKTAGRNNSGPW